MLLLSILLFVAAVVTGQSVDTTIPVGYTNYQETSTDNCTGSASICTQDLPFNVSNPPDVWLDAKVTVPTIILRVDNIQARLNLDAKVASLVSLTAGVSVGISSVQLKISGVNAQVQLAVYLDNIAKIVSRTMASLDLNPLLTSVVDGVFKTANNLLGTLTQNGQLIHQIIDSAGNIINQVLGTTGNVLSSVVVGDYLQNMTFTGISQTLDNGNIIKQYSYPPPASSSQTDNSLINIVFDTLGKVLSTTVVNPGSTPTAIPVVTTASPASNPVG